MKSSLFLDEVSFLLIQSNYEKNNEQKDNAFDTVTILHIILYGSYQVL